VPYFMFLWQLYPYLVNCDWTIPEKPNKSFAQVKNEPRRLIHHKNQFSGRVGGEYSKIQLWITNELPILLIGNTRRHFCNKQYKKKMIIWNHNFIFSTLRLPEKEFVNLFLEYSIMYSLCNKNIMHLLSKWLRSRYMHIYVYMHCPCNKESKISCAIPLFYLYFIQVLCL